MNRPRMKTKFSMYVLLSIFLLALLPNLATADITTTGDISPLAYDDVNAPNPWYVDADQASLGFDANYTDLIIGNTATGTLDINDTDVTSRVNNATGYIGYDATIKGTVDVNGGDWYNYTWEDADGVVHGGDLYVGYNGEGTLNILNDGYVYTEGNGYIAFAAGSDGTVDVNNSTWEIGYYDDDKGKYVGGDLYVGKGGKGVMNIVNGGDVYNYGNGYIAFDAGSIGTVDVNDAGWLIDQDLYVGYGGNGYMNITNGAYVETDENGYIGFAADSVGTVDVTGGQLGEGWDPSEWNIGGELFVGGEGEGTLNIEKGGLVQVGSDDSVYIGDMPGSIGTVTVNGPTIYEEDEDGLFTGPWSYQDRSRLESNGPIYVGVEGDGTLSIENGAHVQSYGSSIIGDMPGSTGSVTVTGPGFYQESTNVNDPEREWIDESQWRNYGQLIVGDEAEGIRSEDGSVESYGGTLSIKDGGYVLSFGGSIGNEKGSTGLVTVTGGESWQVPTGEFDEDDDWSIDGSWWNVNGELIVGDAGDGVMDVNDGGRVTSHGGSIGSLRDSTGSVTVDGENSEWDNDGSLYVGQEGDGTLMISNGGQVSNGNAYIAADLVSTGSVTVTGPNSVWENNGDLYVGGWEEEEEEEYGIPTGGEATLLIEEGGSVESDDGYIGTGELARGTVTVTGEDSEWKNNGELIIGQYEGIGVIDVNNRGYVDSDEIIIGHDGGYGIMDVNDGKVKSKLLGIGIDGGEGEMIISNGSHVENEVLYVGYKGDDEVHYVGYKSDGTLLISDGNMVSDMGYIGTSERDMDYFGTSLTGPRARGSVTVTGEDSAWDINGGLYVGREFGKGELLISDGGKVTSEEGHIGTELFGIGVVTVTGPNSVWENTYDIQVGDELGYYEEDWDEFQGYYERYYPGGTGVLNISDGAVVKAGSVMIAPGGTLSGDGKLVSDSVLNYGTIKPGNSIGTLTIDGNLEFQPDSIYEVEIDNSGNSDLLKVNGDVDIVGGIVQAVSTETITGAQHYTIIEANNVDGEFDTLDTALLDLTMSYSDIGLGYEPNAAGPDLVMLNIDAKRFDDPSIAQNGNQSSLGGALQKIADGGGSPITTALQGLETDDQVRDAYNQLSGQIRPQLTTVAGIDTGKFMDIVSNRMNYADQGISYYGPSSSSMLAMAGPDPTDDNRSTYETRPNFAIGNNEASFGDPKLSFWGKGYGVYGQRDNGSGVAGYDYNIYGSSFGLDYQVSDSSLMGITAGYSTSNIDSYLPGNGGDISGTHIGIYGTKNMDEWHVDSILTGSFLKFETERYVPLMDERVKGDYDGMGISGYVEARYDLQNQSSDSWLIQPLAAFQFSCLSLSEYTETGGENVPLSPDDENYNSYKGSLGIKLTQQLFDRENKRNASVQLRARWIHEFGDDNSSVDSHFASDPGAVFKVSDEDMSRDSAVLGASFNAGLSRHTQFSLGYDTQLNSDNTMHVFSAMFAYRW